jgi:cell division protein FtsQ
MAVPAPADKRFRRAQVKPATRRTWRELPRWKTVAKIAVMLALAVYGVDRGTELMLSADALTVTRITVSGNQRMSRGEVLSLLDGLSGRNMMTVDLEAWRERMLAAPWVADAALRRVLPGAIDVFISERQPMGIGRIGQDLYLVDERGELIDEYGPNYADLDLPIIDGLAAANGGDGLLIDRSRAALAGRVLTELQAHPALAAKVSQLDVSDVRDAVVVLENDTVLVRIGDSNFAERLQSYLELVPALRERVPNIDYVDLRFDERVYVRPHGDGRSPGSGRTQGNHRN